MISNILYYLNHLLNKSFIIKIIYVVIGYLFFAFSFTYRVLLWSFLLFNLLLAILKDISVFFFFPNFG